MTIPRDERRGMHGRMLADPIVVTLSVSDWVLLCGWASAHLTADTPAVITAAVRSIGEQVRGA